MRNDIDVVENVKVWYEKVQVLSSPEFFPSARTTTKGHGKNSKLDEDSPLARRAFLSETFFADSPAPEENPRRKGEKKIPRRKIGDESNSELFVGKILSSNSYSSVKLKKEKHSLYEKRTIM